MKRSQTSCEEVENNTLLYIETYPCCRKMRLGVASRGVAHSLACRARVELAMAEANDPRWNAAIDRQKARMVELYPKPRALRQGSSGAGGLRPAKEEKEAPATSRPEEWIPDAGCRLAAGPSASVAAPPMSPASAPGSPRQPVATTKAPLGEDNEDDKIIGILVVGEEDSKLLEMLNP